MSRSRLDPKLGMQWSCGWIEIRRMRHRQKKHKKIIGRGIQRWSRDNVNAHMLGNLYGLSGQIFARQLPALVTGSTIPIVIAGLLSITGSELLLLL